MKNLTHKLWAKAAAFLLFCLTVPLALGCVAGAFYSWDQGWYWEKDANFAESSLCISSVYNETARISEYIDGKSDAAEITAVLPEDSGYSFLVTDPAGKVLADTTTPESVEVVPSGTINPEDGETGSAVAGYVNLPVARDSSLYPSYMLFSLLFSLHLLYLPVGIAAALLSVILFLFLLTAAGRKEGSEKPVAEGLNRIPFDLYAAVCAVAGSVLFVAAGESAAYSYGSGIPALAGMAFSLAGICAVSLAFLMSAAARIKTGKWWRNTITYKVCSFMVRTIRTIYRSLPLVWQTVLAYVSFGFMNILLLSGAIGGSGFSLLLMILFDLAALAVLCRGSLEMRRLMKAGESLASGDLSHTVNTSDLHLSFRSHGENLNSISVGMSRAVEDRLKSERFKAELITNVSHDLKTPLTSIVTYIDLLKKEEIPGETARGYIEVLDRQSAKLKKLTEDLVEASKASTGAVTVNREKLDASELLNQIAGEYGERFKACGIIPVVHVPENPVMICADGRLMGRVFDNIMQNIAKYAMPGTRAYFDLVTEGGRAVFELKNISAAPLNISPDELMERFVRGDASRSTEGSGLGLSIARSLAELQEGRLEILLDGDLFKVRLSFPAL